MKFNAYQRFTFTAELYRMEPDTTNPNGGEVPVFDRVISLDFANDPNSVRNVALTSEVVDNGSLISNVRDKHGNLFMGNTAYSVTRVTPVFNVWGTFEFYQLTLAVNSYALVQVDV
jgi:hypothetical protein